VAALDADLLVLGEMGIGNTTAAAAVAAALGGGEVAAWVGRGTGVDDEGLDRKRDAVRLAVDRIAGVLDPLEVLREVGGAELVAMAAAIVAARHRGCRC
jgi:nicotinate-nucleotide--dimethylbenzimidazole phosphoribosyltransferase